jgi:hypothetical protein
MSKEQTLSFVILKEQEFLSKSASIIIDSMMPYGK